MNINTVFAFQQQIQNIQYHVQIKTTFKLFSQALKDTIKFVSFYLLFRNI